MPYITHLVCFGVSLHINKDIGSRMCVLAAASCHAASRLFGESESVISLDPAPRGPPAPPPGISLEPQRLNGQVIDARTCARTHTVTLLAFQSPLPRWGPCRHIKATFPCISGETCRRCLTSLYAQ